MALTVANLRTALERSPGLAGVAIRRSEPWRPPVPLPWFVTADPILKLAVIAAAVAPAIIALAYIFSP